MSDEGGARRLDGDAERSERFFRHEYGRLVSVLSRRAGVAHLPEVEDAVQFALVQAVEIWPRTGAPRTPEAWLFRVAERALIGALRTRARRERIVRRATEAPSTGEGGAPLWDGPGASVDGGASEDVRLRGEVQDDLLRMLFVCCDEGLPTDTQMVLALKILCGFTVREIAQRLFRSEADVYKRVERGRRRLREGATDWDEVELDLEGRLPAVQATLYLLFTEGHLSSGELSLRRDLCDEAVRLATLLTEPPLPSAPSTRALLALMYLHRARLSARWEESLGLVLLEEQDRRSWDHRDIATGLGWLARSAEGETFSRYHAEASIAAAHCLAPTFADTDWNRIAQAYALLERLVPSPLHRLNRALAVAEGEGPSAGLSLLSGLSPPAWLEGSYLWAAALADLHRRAGHEAEARAHRAAALRLAPSEAVRSALCRRLGCA